VPVVERHPLLTRASVSVHVLRPGGDVGEALERRVHAVLGGISGEALLEALEGRGLYS
jgi:hypothetical protein